jgi:hypothetical protein
MVEEKRGKALEKQAGLGHRDLLIIGVLSSAAALRRQAQVRSAAAQKRHILLAFRSFVRLEAHRLQTGVSWYEAKTSIVREAIRTYLTHPTYALGLIGLRVYVGWWVR